MSYDKLNFFLIYMTFFFSTQTNAGVIKKNKQEPQIKTINILFLGDSLTEGYQLAKSASFPFQVGEIFKSLNKNVKILNAGISGSTSASALPRLKWNLKAKLKPHILVLALGANDGLRGLSPKKMYQNLSTTIELAHKNKLKVILCGIKVPPNYGPQYTKEFEQVFTKSLRSIRLFLCLFC